MAETTSNGKKENELIKLMRWFRKTARVTGPILDLTNSIYHPAAKDSSQVIESSGGQVKPRPAPQDLPNKKTPIN